MARKVTLLLMILMIASAGSAWGQYQRPPTVRRAPPAPTAPTHKFEIHGLYGYMWTTSRSATYGLSYGALDIDGSGYWGLALDINLHSLAQLELLYTRQDSKLVYRSGFDSNEWDIAVEYFQIGMVKGLQQGKVMPFTSVTLGATRFSSDDSVSGDDWLFSMILGLGAKVYLGERMGLRFQGRLPFSFTSTGIGLGFGTGGSYVTVGGTGILQTELSAGLFIRI